jgi:3-oxoacyl-[acyl-carrier protein] reductase
MDLELSKRNFIVTGSTRGIGRGIAERLLTEGARVAITGRDTTCLAETCSELEERFSGCVVPVCGDLTTPQAVELLAEAVDREWGELHGVVANVGGVRPSESWNVDRDTWEWFFDANFLTATMMMPRFVPYLVRSRGAIVVIGSIAGLEDVGAPLPYSSSKAALSMYTKGLARQLGPDNVRVNMVAPGNIIFPGGNWDNRLRNDEGAVTTMLEAKVPLRRFGTPAEIADTTAFLLSPRSSFTTGACLVVDGGQTESF